MTSYADQVIALMGIVKYRGCLIYPRGGKWFVFRREHDSLEDAKREIDEAAEALQKSINKNYNNDTTN